MLKSYLSVILFSLCSFSVAADELSITIGGFYSHSDSSMDVTNPSLGNEFELDFESDLELKEKQFLPFFELQYQFNERHHFTLDWKQLHREGVTQGVTQAFQMQIDDTVYDVKAGNELSTTLNIDIARLSYGYDFYQGDDLTLGFSLGLHTMFIETGFEGIIDSCNAGSLINNICTGQTIPAIIDESVTAPLPNLGLYANYSLSPGWEFKAHAQYLQIKLDDVEGRLIDIKAGVEAQISERWFMSAAFNYFQVDVDIEQGTQHSGVADLNVSYSFIGPMLSVSYKF